MLHERRWYPKALLAPLYFAGKMTSMFYLARARLSTYWIALLVLRVFCHRVWLPILQPQSDFVQKAMHWLINVPFCNTALGWPWNHFQPMRHK